METFTPNAQLYPNGLEFQNTGSCKIENQARIIKALDDLREIRVNTSNQVVRDSLFQAMNSLSVLLQDETCVPSEDLPIFQAGRQSGGSNPVFLLTVHITLL